MPRAQRRFEIEIDPGQPLTSLIRRVLAASELSSYEIARRAGLTPSTVWKFLSEKGSMTLESIDKILSVVILPGMPPPSDEALENFICLAQKARAEVEENMVRDIVYALAQARWGALALSGQIPHLSKGLTRPMSRTSTEGQEPVSIPRQQRVADCEPPSAKTQRTTSKTARKKGRPRE